MTQVWSLPWKVIMGKAILRVFLFLIVLICIFVYVGHTITAMTGGFDKKVVVEGINVDAGEQIYFGKGKCSACHSIGDRGSAIRCPNLGVKGEQFNIPIGQRAFERAKQRAESTGKPWNAVDYLYECIADPGAFVAPGYKNEMPTVYQPPIGLSPDEVKAVVMFLAAQGDDIPDDQILKPTGIAKEFLAKIEAYAAEGGDGAMAQPFKPYMDGNISKGQKLFWDMDSKVGCAKCHAVGEFGGEVGPSLTSIAGTRTMSYIIESIVKPSEVIVSGYEPLLVMTNDGERIAGTKKEDTPEHFVIGLPTGEIKKIMKSDIKKSKIMKKSIMPGNLAEILSIEEFYDVFAYVQTLNGDNTDTAIPDDIKMAAAPTDGTADGQQSSPDGESEKNE